MSEQRDDDDYLWDGRGKPDPEVERLEKLLRPLAFKGAPPSLPTRLPARRGGWIAVGATLAVAAAAVLVWWVQHPPAAPDKPILVERAVDAGTVAPAPPPSPTKLATASTPSWACTSVDGNPPVTAQPGRLHQGAWLETDHTSRAQLAVADIGQVTVEPRSRVRLVHTSGEEHRLELAHGTIKAKVYARPRLFIVDTPAFTAVDLGCAYTLTVDDKGAGQLHVTSGSVALENHGRDSVVPAGASCETRPGDARGHSRLGTPYFDDASAPFRAALSRFDFAADAPALDEVLSTARPRDTLSLLHLIAAVPPAERRRVVERMRALGARLPSRIRKDAILSLDRDALDKWRDVLRPTWYARR